MCSKENSRESPARREGLKLCLGFVVIASAEMAELSVLTLCGQPWLRGSLSLAADGAGLGGGRWFNAGTK